MARFIGRISPDRADVTRLSHRSLRVSARGWDIGGTAFIHRASDTVDHLALSIDGGSNGGSRSIDIALFERRGGETVCTHLLTRRELAALGVKFLKA